MTDFNAITVAQAMLAYADQGISSFPCNGKIPLTEHGHKDATRLPEKIRAWAGKEPSAVGIPTGKENGFFVLDVDAKGNGLENLKILEQRHGSLPETLTVKTGGGGMHYYFLCPDFEIKNSAGDIAAGIDVRGDGGFIIAPPSIHDSGNRYDFMRAITPDSFKRLAEAPDWLLERLRPEAGQYVPKAPSHWHDLMLNGVDEGQRNSTIASLSGYLLAHKLDPHVAFDFILFWNKQKCRPPLPQDEVEQVFESILKLETQKRRKS